MAGPGRPRPYQPEESGGGSSLVWPMTRLATLASATSTPYRAAPRRAGRRSGRDADHPPVPIHHGDRRRRVRSGHPRDRHAGRHADDHGRRQVRRDLGARDRGDTLHPPGDRNLGVALRELVSRPRTSAAALTPPERMALRGEVDKFIQSLDEIRDRLKS